MQLAWEHAIVFDQPASGAAQFSSCPWGRSGGSEIGSLTLQRSKSCEPSAFCTAAEGLQGRQRREVYWGPGVTAAQLHVAECHRWRGTAITLRLQRYSSRQEGERRIRAGEEREWRPPHLR